MKTKLLTILTVLLMAAAAWSATSFSGNTKLIQSWVYHKTGEPTTIAENFSTSASRLLDWDHTSGEGANKMDVLFRERVTLTNGASRTVNLATGVVNSFGDTVTFDEVRFLAVSCNSANGNNVTVGNAATNEFDSWCGGTNQTVTVTPGGIWVMIAPDATGYDSSTDGNLKVLNAGTNSVTYDLWVGGSD